MLSDMNTSGVDKYAIQTMKRPALQRLAKEKGVRAVGPDERIRAALLELFSGEPCTRKDFKLTAAEGPTQEILQDIKNLTRVAQEERQLEPTCTRKSARLTVKETPSAEASKADGEKGLGPDSQHDRVDHEKPKSKELIPQDSSSDADEFRAKFEAALALVGFHYEIRIYSTMKPSAADLLQKLDRKRKADDGPATEPQPDLEEPLPVRPRQKRRRTKCS